MIRKFLQLSAVFVASLIGGAALIGVSLVLAISWPGASAQECTAKVDDHRVSKLRLELGGHRQRLELARQNGWSAETTEMLIRRGEAELDIELNPCRQQHKV